MLNIGFKWKDETVFRLGVAFKMHLNLCIATVAVRTAEGRGAGTFHTFLLARTNTIRELITRAT